MYIYIYIYKFGAQTVTDDWLTGTVCRFLGNIDPRPLLNAEVNQLISRPRASFSAAIKEAIYASIELRTWISNCIHIKFGDVSIHWYFDYNGSLSKAPLK